MSALLAVISEDPEGGYNVVDSRDGRSLAWRTELADVNELAWYLNHTYPASTVAPAFDTLVHEIVGVRVSGEPCLSLEAILSVGTFDPKCPAFVPFGPGWDHLYSEDESPGPSWYRRA